MTLFSYVVDHDLGFAPNPYSGYCTLVHCKFGGSEGPRNIVELAKVGDWILGSGGRSKQSAGHGKLIYLMRVDEKPTIKAFLADRRFHGRDDCHDFGNGNTSALVSERYFYFGKNAPNIADLPKELRQHLVKKGPGFRRDCPEQTIMALVEWIGLKYKVGMHGDPCASTEASIKVRRRAECSL